MVELRIHIINAEAERVCALYPGKVRRPDELVIAEKKRVPGVIVADIGPPTVDFERGDAALQEVRAICAGNSQHIQPEVRNDIKALRAQVLARVTNVPVQDHAGAERVRTPD